MDFSKRTFRSLVKQSNKMIENWYSKKIRGEKIYENKTPSEIKKVFHLEKKISNANQKMFSVILIKTYLNIPILIQAQIIMVT